MAKYDSSWDEDWDNPLQQDRGSFQKRNKSQAGWDIPKDLHRSVNLSKKYIIARLLKAEAAAVSCCHRSNIKRKSCPCGTPIDYVACKTCGRVICSDQCLGLRNDDLSTEISAKSKQQQIPSSNEQPTSSARAKNRSSSNAHREKEAKTSTADIKNPFGSSTITSFDWRHFYIAADDSDEDSEAEDTDEYLTCVKSHSEGFTRNRKMEEYVGEKVKIVHMSSTNRAYIVPEDVYETYILDIMDEVNDLCMNATKSSHDPQPGSLACVWISERSEVMFRCLVLETNELIRKARVYLLDFGKVHYYNYEYIWPFSQDLLEMDLLGFEARIKGFPGKIHCLTSTRFAEFQFFMYKQELKLKSVQKNTDGYYEVELEDSIGNLTRHLSSYEAWEWKKCIKERGPSDDEAVIAALKQSKDEFADGWEENLFWKHPMKMKCCGINKKNSTAEFCELQNDQILRDFRILNKQIMRYSQSVRSSPFFPSNNALCLASKAGGRWLRAVRIGVTNELYCLDTGDRIEKFTEWEDIQVRRVPHEFFRVVPIGRIVCKLEGTNSANACEQLEVGKFYKVQITSLPATDSLYLGLLVGPDP